MEDTDQTPCTALSAADELAHDGAHVHVVGDGYVTCHTGHCDAEEWAR